MVMRRCSFRGTSPVVATAIGCLFTALLTGCGSSRWSVESSLPAGGTARVRALGDNPFVLVANGGPGWVEVEWPPEAAGGGGVERLVAGSAGRSIRGGGLLIVRAGPDGGAHIEIEAQRARRFEWASEATPEMPEMP